MKVGSLVVVLPFQDNPEIYKKNGWVLKWEPIKDAKTIYVVRGFNIVDAVLFEEGIIGYDYRGGELGILKASVREVQPPISSEEIAELVEDACCVERS